MGGAEHGPLASDLVDAVEEELTKASCLLDLPKHRLNDLLAQSIATAMPGPLERRGHGDHPGLALQAPSRDMRLVAAISPASGRHVGPDATLGHGLEIGLAREPCIGGHLDRLAAQRLLGGID